MKPYQWGQQASIRTGNVLGKFLRWAAARLEDGAHRVERCPYCGENRWSGRDCVAVLGYMPGREPSVTVEGRTR